jgi:cobalt-zinc-cadmium efflux system outer membrane protein
MHLHPPNRTVAIRRLAALTAYALFALVGCQTPPHAPDPNTVSAHLTQRVGQTVGCDAGTSGVVLPPGASLDDGVTDDEAVAIALWNNASFQELLVDLGLARSDLIQAGLLPNPEFVYFFGVTDKPFKYLFDFPIEAIWLRPIRVKAAAKEADRTAQRLTQAGLDLMRDVRQAYADVVLAKERVRIAGEAVRLRGRIAELAEIRLKAGDISPQEAATAKIDALQAEQDATRIGYDVPVFEERLRNLMGVGPLRGALPLDPAPPPACQTFDVDALTHEAMRSRPDALAAAEAVAAAEARLRFAKLGWVRLLGIADATSGKNGHEFGPGLRFTVPLFNRNQGGVARAEAELERAVRNQKTVAYQIILDVQRAYLQYRQACAELDVLRTKVRPEVETAIRRAQAAYQEGNVTIFIVLETTRQLLDNYLREAVLTGDLRRFWAELERSAGRRLAPPVTPPAPVTPSDMPPKKLDQSKAGVPSPATKFGPAVSVYAVPAVGSLNARAGR